MGERALQEAVVEAPVGFRARGRATSERSLVRGAGEGDPEAAGELARRHWDRAHHAAYLIVRDAGAAEDIAQESILTGLETLRRFDRRRAFGPWLHRIVVNRSIDWLRSRERRGEVLADTNLEPAEDPGEPADADRLGRALSALDPQTRAVVVLRCVLDYRAGEIARMLDTTAGAVRTRLHRGLRDLRQRLSEEMR